MEVPLSPLHVNLAMSDEDTAAMLATETDIMRRFTAHRNAQKAAIIADVLNISEDDARRIAEVL